MHNSSIFSGSKDYSSLYLPQAASAPQIPTTTYSPSTRVTNGIACSPSLNNEGSSLDLNRFVHILRDTDSEILSVQEDLPQRPTIEQMRLLARNVGLFINSEPKSSPLPAPPNPFRHSDVPLEQVSLPFSPPRSRPLPLSHFGPPKLKRVEPVNFPSPLESPQPSQLSPLRSYRAPLCFSPDSDSYILATPDTTPPITPKGDILCDESMAQFTPRSPVLFSNITESPDRSDDESTTFVRESPLCPTQAALEKFRQKSVMWVTLEDESQTQKRLFHSKYRLVTVPSLTNQEGYTFRYEERDDPLPLNSRELDELVNSNS